MNKKTDPVQEKIADLIKDIEARIEENNKTISQCTSDNKESKRMLKELKKLTGKDAKTATDSITTSENAAENQNNSLDNMQETSAEKEYPAPLEMRD